MNRMVLLFNNLTGRDQMNGIKSGASHCVTETPQARDSAIGLAPREPVSFKRATHGAAGQATAAVRLSGPKAVATALMSRCTACRAELQKQDRKHSDFLGRDGNASVFFSPERAEVCIQTGMDVCTVKSDGRVFLNGDLLERHQPGFLHMQRTLADLGPRIAAGELHRAGSAGNDISTPPPWDRKSDAHGNYVL
ncbi:hypothetical protein ACSFA3_12720 [Variovorax sp. RHLX14]|uniref:hypothetical protein n=1 Tax=Variovorax sp. RHLX14 TaxID=1259731 RepID=UPI003F454FE4